MRAARRSEAKDAEAQTGKGGISYVSAGLMRGRTAQGFSSYGARLYAEGVEDRRRREHLVRCPCPAQSGRPLGASWEVLGTLAVADGPAAGKSRRGSVSHKARND